MEGLQFGQGEFKEKLKLSRQVYLVSITYFILTVLLHWRLHPDLGIFLYLIGAVIGLYLLEMIELAFKSVTSPFRTVLAQVIITILSLFVITSTNNLLGKGLILFLNLRYVYLQRQELQTKKTLGSWLSNLNFSFNENSQRWYIRVIFGLFLFETILFIAV